jgi:hypothetical protein
MNDASELAAVVERELQRITDTKLVGRIRELMVPPYPVEREWQYGVVNEHYTCWTVLEHRASNSGIAFCNKGFGPSYPWGLVFLDGPHSDIGMDSGWFASLEDAMRESMAWEGTNPERYEVQ